MLNLCLILLDKRYTDPSYSFSMNLICWSKKGIKNFQATIENFTDSPQALISMLKQVDFYEKAVVQGAYPPYGVRIPYNSPIKQNKYIIQGSII